MDLALPAIVVLAVLIPGLLLVRGYRGAFGTRFQGIAALPGGITTDFLWSLLLSPVPHGLAIVLTRRFTAHDPSPGFVLYLLDTADPAHAGVVAQIAGDLPPIAAYLALAAVLGLLLGTALHWSVRKLQLDWQFDVLRFPNPWHYVLSAPDSPGKRFIGAFAAVTVEFAGKGYLYLGTVAGHDIDGDGNLVRLRMRDVLRREFANDRPPGTATPSNPYDDARFYEIECDEFVLWMKDAKSLNVIHAFRDVD